MATQKTIYRFTRPDNGKVVFVEKGGRPVRWATFGLFTDGWQWIGYSSAEEFTKAARAGRGTNPYASEYTAVPLTVVSAEERDAERNPTPAPTTPDVATQSTESTETQAVAYVDMIEPRRGLILVTGVPGFTDSPQGRIGYDEDRRAWFVDDQDENGIIVYRSSRNVAITAYLQHLSNAREHFNPKDVKIKISREY